MTGAEILNTEVVYVVNYSALPLIISVICGALAGFFFMGLDGGWFDFGDAIAGAVLGCIVGFIMGLFLTLATATKTDEIDYIKHDVIISDEVNFNEFTEQYEIIEHKGKIYTVKEKTK